MLSQHLSTRRGPVLPKISLGRLVAQPEILSLVTRGAADATGRCMSEQYTSLAFLFVASPFALEARFGDC